MPEALVPYENIGHRIEQLQEYLQNLLQIDLYRDHHETVSTKRRQNICVIRITADVKLLSLVVGVSRASFPFVMSVHKLILKHELPYLKNIKV